MKRDPQGGSFTSVADFYDHLMRLVPYGAWVRYIDTLCRKYGSEPATLLDLACGTGTVSLIYARRGVRVVGVDSSLPMLRVAARKIRNGGGKVLFVQQDATRLSLRDGFDLCISLFDSLNYIIGVDRLRAAFKGVARALSPGGLFLFDVNTVRALELNLFTQDNLGMDDWLQYNWVSHWDARSRMCRVEMEFDARGQKFHETHYQMGYEIEEISDLLGAARLEVLDVFDAYRLSPVHSRSTRAFFAARK